MRERGRNYLLSACSASRYKLRTPSRLYLIIQWPRNLWISPACSLPFSTELCPSPHTYSHLCPKWLQSLMIPGSPQLLPNKPFPRLPSLRDTPPSSRLAMWSLSFSSHLFTLVYLVFDAGVDPTCYIIVCRAHSAGK